MDAAAVEKQSGHPKCIATHSNDRTLTKTYDQDYAIDKVVSSDPNGLVLDMTTDVMGNIVNASDSVAGTPVRRYAYDALYRLSRADNASNVMQEDYAYNKTGIEHSSSSPGKRCRCTTMLQQAIDLAALLAPPVTTTPTATP